MCTRTSTREIQVLLSSVRTALGTEGAEHLAASLRHDLDWTYLVQIAREHGVMPPLYRSLTASGPDAAPAAVIDRLGGHFRDNARRNLFLMGELLELLALFEAHSVSAVPLKGPILARSIYGSVSLRQFTDLDILLRPRDVPLARELLSARGYGFLSLEETSVQAVRDGNNGRVTIDLQWALADARFRFPLDQQMWSRFVPVSIGRTMVLHPAPEDQILILCSHPAKHSWSRLGWISDIAAFLQTQAKGVNWTLTLDRARRLGGERMLLLGLRLSADLVGTTVPVEALPRMRADKAVASLASELRQRLFEPAGELRRLNGSYGFVDAGILYIKSRERIVDKVPHALFLLRVLLGWCTLIPNDRDRAVVALPGYLAFLYYFVRPFRLAKKYGVRLIQRSLQMALVWQ